MSLPVSEQLLPPYLRESGKVIYSTGDTHGSLYWMNFCHFCKELRDHKDMIYEIEGRRCISCTENFTWAESTEKETGCPQCFECPVCSQAMVVRSSAAPSSSPVKSEEPASSDKRYYLTCQNCRWSTRGAGIPDATRLPAAATPWRFRPEGLQESTDSLNALSEFYRGLAIVEKSSTVTKTKEKRNRSRIAYNPLIPDKYKLVSVAQKRISGTTDIQPDLVALETKVPKVQFVENLKEISEDELFGFADPKVAEARLPLDARLKFPLEQPETANNLQPRNRPLAAKKTWRCKSCQHVLVKTDISTNSVKFKMISSAPLLVPTIKPCRPNKFIVGEICEFVVVISNPLNHAVNISFTFPPTNEPKPTWINGQIPEDVKLPVGPVTLLSRNCAAGIDEKGKEAVTTTSNDEPTVVAFRKLFITGVKFSCVPQSSSIDTWISFLIRYDFRDTQTTVFESEKTAGGDASAAQCTWITLRVDMNLGKADGPT